MTDAVYSVMERNRAVEIPAIGIRCNEKEIPQPIDGEPTAHFVGWAVLIHDRPVVNASGVAVEAASVQGVFSACVFGQTMAVIVAPRSEQFASFWFVVDLAASSVSPVGSVGVFGKRPGSIEVESDDLTVRFSEPARYVEGRNPKFKKSAEMLTVLQEAQAGVDPQHSQVPGVANREADRPVGHLLGDIAVFVMWLVAGGIGLAGVVFGLTAGALLYLAASLIVAVLWWPFVTIGGFFFGPIELLELPPIAVAVAPWFAFVGAAVLSVQTW